MGTIADKLNKALANKADIKAALIEKGRTPSDNMSTYGDEIRAIETGGGGPAGDYRVRFFDYDGTYKDVWVNEGEDAVPPEMPDYSQEGYLRPPLTFQGWNKPYTNITKDTEIGAVYIPTDGKTHFYLQITGGTGKDITLYVGNNEGGNIVINWGDGTEFSSTLTSISASHTFAYYGVYHCTIENTSTGDFQLGGGSNNTTFCGGNQQYMRDALIAIYLGEKVQINSHSFYYYHALKYVTIPNNVTSIRSYAFSCCYSLTNVIIPNSVTSIENGAFDTCRSLTNVIIPSSVTSIGSYAFQYCYPLTNVTIPNSVISIDTNTFNGCYSLTNLIIPNSVTSIGPFAFRFCYSLTNLTIPNGITSIANYAFGFCCSLTNVTIPSSVNAIENYAFASCHSLKKVFIEGDTVKTLSNSNAFTNIPKSTLFFVKDELVESYKVATNWSTYANQIMPMSQEANYFG